MTFCASRLCSRPTPFVSSQARTARRPSGLIVLAALAFLLLVGVDPGRALAGGPEGQTITEVRIQGAETLSEDKIRAKILSRAGRECDVEAVDADLRSLKQTNWFSHVGVSYLEDPERGGIILIYKVVEAPVLSTVEFRGRSKLSLKQLEEATGLKKGVRADHVRTLSAVGQIRRLYEEKGYLLAEVRLIEGDKPGAKKAIFEILEGPKFQVSEIRFEGNEVFSDATLRTKIQSKPPILGLIGGHYDAESPETDARKIVELYQSIGYFECQCTPVVSHGDDVGQVQLSFRISEGPKYTVRSIKFEGNKKIPEAELRAPLVLHSGQPFRDDLRQRDLKTLTEKYNAIGCIDAAIIPEPMFTDTPGVVDLVYRIEEGEQFLLGEIRIRGNERTRDKVVRREFDASGLLPGEPLDGTRIEAARKRLDNTRFFTSSPEAGGNPISIQITNRRSSDQPYGEQIQKIDLDEVIQARLQSPDSPPPLPPDLPGFDDGPVLGRSALGQVVPFGSGGAFEPAPGELPPVRGEPGGLVPRYPPPNESPPGTFPTTPGSNLTDVGPDLTEPFGNRSYPNIATQVEPAPGRSYADIDVQVEEAPTGRIMFGIGAGSNTGLSGNFIIHERNFDLFNLPRSPRELFNGQAFRGAGQEFRLELSPGTQINRALVSFREPSLFDRDISLSTSGYIFSRFQPYFNEARGGGRFSLGRQFGPSVYADVAARIEQVRINGFTYPAPADFIAASGNTFLATLRPSVHFDTRNDPFLPSEGSYAELAFEQGWGDFTFPKFTAEARRHFTVRSRPDLTGKHILTLRGFFGISGQDTPVYERFYAGDFRSLRGFAYRGVGPFVYGNNVGGILSTVGSVEYMLPLTANDRFQWVVFSDFGTVENSYDIKNFRVSAGTGLRITIPALGPLPLAFDIAFPILKGPDDKERVFNFFMGAFY